MDGMDKNGTSDKNTSGVEEELPQSLSSFQTVMAKMTKTRRTIYNVSNSSSSSSISYIDVSSDSSDASPATARRSSTDSNFLVPEIESSPEAYFYKNMHNISMAEYKAIHVVYHIFLVLQSPWSTTKTVEKYRDFEKNWDVYRQQLKELPVSKENAVTLPPTPVLPGRFSE